METKFNSDFLDIVSPENFLPPISKWTSLGGMIMLGSAIAAIASASIFKYPVVVKAPFQVRPQGELAVVQTLEAGKVKKILVRDHQVINQGNVIAYLDDSLLQQNKHQLQLKINYTQQSIERIEEQIATKKRQVATQVRQIERNIASLQGELKLRQNNYQKAIIDSSAALAEAQASFNLAQDELTRYQNLANTGGISLLQLSEKKAAYDTAKARLEKSQKQLNPSNIEIIIAQEKLAEEIARKETQLILLEQEKQQLNQQLWKTKGELDSDRQELLKINSNIDRMTIRSSITGTIQELKVSKEDRVLQVGDEIATIVPSQSNLLIQTAVPIANIEKIKLNQKVRLKVSSCPYTDYGTLSGKTIAIAPDATYFEEREKDSYYQVTIETDSLLLANEREKCIIRSGMNGQAEIITRQDTILNFVLRKARLLVN